jgi:phage-related protein
MPILAYNKPMRKSKSEIIKIDPTEEQEIIFWPDNLTEEIKNDWSLEMRKEGGFQLGRVQQGFEPNNYRLMPIIGSGVKEIKLQDEGKNQYRLVYIAKFEEAITKKTTETTSKHDIELAKKRLGEINQHRQLSKRKSARTYF